MPEQPIIQMTEAQKLEVFQRWYEDQKNPELRLSRELKEVHHLPEEVYDSLTRGQKEQLFSFLDEGEDYEDLVDVFLSLNKEAYLSFLVGQAKEYEERNPWEDYLVEESEEEVSA